MRTTPALACLALSLVATALPKVAAAVHACDSAELNCAWGDFEIRRTSSGTKCALFQRRYTCAATNGYRTEYAEEDSGTAIDAALDTACEATTGYTAMVAGALAHNAAGSGNFECGGTYTDADQDGFPSAIDENDNDPRIWVKTTGVNERYCDAVDNDADGTTDDGFSPACNRDLKRIDVSANMQGDASSRVNLIEGALLRDEPPDVVTEGPYGPLSFTRRYTSQRDTNDCALGKGWTSNLCVYLTEMPDNDDRWQVTGPNGENQYHRCLTIDSDNASCVVDDHRPRGNLRRVSGRWWFYPGDSTRWRFSETVTSGRRSWDRHEDSAGFVLAEASFNGSDQIEKVSSANSDVFLYFTYASGALDKIRLKSDSSSNNVVDFDVSGSSTLDQVSFASTFGTIDSNVRIQYDYDGSDNLSTVTRQLDSTNVPTASFTHDGSDRVTELHDASKYLTLDYSTALAPEVTFVLGSSPVTTFTHNGLWLKSRDSDLHLGGMSAQNTTRDEHGRVTCYETDDSAMTKLIYAETMSPTRVDEYGKAGGSSCSSGGSSPRQRWTSYGYNTLTQSWRVAWQRAASIYSPASDCTGGSLPSGCRETSYTYESSTDDRVQWITTTGTTRVIDNATPQQQIRKRRFYYFGLDTGTCASSGDWYTGLLCRVEAQDNSSNVLSRIAYTYVPSGSTAGLLKTATRHKSSSASLSATTYASHNVFGQPTQVTSESGMVSDLSYNGWGALTQVVENDGLLSDGDSPTLIDRTTSYSYNRFRRLETTTYPLGNKWERRFHSSDSDMGRLKSERTRDSSDEVREILRYEHDDFGHRTETKILDSLSSGCTEDGTPCANETRERTDFDALGRPTTRYLYRTSLTTADATTTYTYYAGKLYDLAAPPCSGLIGSGSSPAQ